MLENIDFSSIIFLDIETASCVKDFASLSSEMKELWTRKCQVLLPQEKNINEELAGKMFSERAAIYSEFGKVICACLGYLQTINGRRRLRIKSFSGENENTLLSRISEIFDNISEKSEKFLCAHNGKEFDFPYLSRRMIIQSVRIPKILRLHGKKPWDVRHLDTLELWKFGDRKAYTSLALLATVLGIPSPKTDMDGSRVSYTYWEEKNMEKIVSYCSRDVITLVQIFMRLCEKEIIKEEEIEIVKEE